MSCSKDRWQRTRRSELPSIVPVEMLSSERVELESACGDLKFHISGNLPFADDTILVSFWWVFFSIHAWFLLFVSSENPSRGNQVFSCLYQC